MEKIVCPFGQMFREQRKAQGISIWTLALRLPYRQGNIQRIERGLHEPRIGLAIRMLSAIEVNAGTVLETLARQERLLDGEEENVHFLEPDPVEWESYDRLKAVKCPFGPLLRECRLEYGTSQRIVAETTGYTLRNLINVEKGAQEPGVMLALKLVIASGGIPKIFFHKLQMIMKKIVS